MKIGSINLKGRVFLAPMAGFTDLPFRLLCQKYGASLTFSEMVNARALSDGNKTATSLATIAPKENVAVQLFGNDPESFRKAAKIVKSKIVDINFGCPAARELKNCEGAGLLDFPDKMEEIVQAVKDSGKIVTAKIRLGNKKINIIENCKVLEEAGVSAITIHARTVKQGYSGTADWDYIKKAKEIVSIPIVGNGDIDSYKKVNDALKIADFCMIGRAAMGKPRLFKAIKEKKDFVIDLNDQIDDFFEYAKLAKKHGFDQFARLRVQALRFITGVKGASSMRNDISRIENQEELFKILKKIRK